MRVLTIQPLPLGWSLRIAGVANDTIFRSGAAAEATARRVADRLAAEGEPAKLIVRFRDGSVAGQFLFPPCPAVAEVLLD